MGPVDRCPALDLDDEGRVRLDTWELAPAVQNAVAERWSTAISDTITELADLDWFSDEARRLYGFAVEVPPLRARTTRAKSSRDFARLLIIPRSVQGSGGQSNRPAKAGPPTTATDAGSATRSSVPTPTLPRLRHLPPPGLLAPAP